MYVTEKYPGVLTTNADTENTRIVHKKKPFLSLLVNDKSSPLSSIFFSYVD